MIEKKEIIKLSIEIHGNKYNYDLVEDVKNKYEKIKLICPLHGIFEQTFYNHIKLKRGCPECGKNKSKSSRKMMIGEFIEKASKNHQDIDNYDFSEFNLYDRDEYRRVTITCKKHGEFKIRPNHFINGVGCQKCKCLVKRSNEEIREELKLIHPEYDFTVTNLDEMDEHHNVQFICPKHGLQKASYYNLRNGQGCNLCRYDKVANKRRIDYKTFVERAEKIHGKGRYIVTEKDFNERDKKTC